MRLTGMAHVALTVTDLKRSRGWYERVLGWASVFDGEGEGVRFAVGSVSEGLLIGLREYGAGERAAFDPVRVGLDHLAFSVPADDLPHWERHLTDLEVTHDQVQNTPFGLVLNFKDLDGIALELTAARD